MTLTSTNNAEMTRLIAIKEDSLDAADKYQQAYRSRNEQANRQRQDSNFNIISEIKSQLDSELLDGHAKIIKELSQAASVLAKAKTKLENHERSEVTQAHEIRVWSDTLTMLQGRIVGAERYLSSTQIAFDSSQAKVMAQAKLILDDLAGRKRAEFANEEKIRRETLMKMIKDCDDFEDESIPILEDLKRTWMQFERFSVRLDDIV